MFSVVIPLYNKAAEIERCLDSILGQTFAAMEVVIVDDGSTDKSATIVESYTSDPRVRLISQANAGVAEARNHGVREARHEWIAFLDADDSWLPAHLETLRDLSHANPQADFLATGYWTDRGRNMRRKVSLSRFAQMPGSFLSLPDGLLVPSCTAIRQRALLTVGGFREMFGEDLDLWFRVGALFSFAYTEKATAVWHLDAGNRRCDNESSSVEKYRPGSLMPSLGDIARISGDRRIQTNARQFFRRRERNALLATIRGGDRAHGVSLYEWWKEQFQARDRMIEAELRLPRWLHRLTSKIRDTWRKSMSLAGYGMYRLGFQ